MYNNFSSKKTKKVISALLASALVVTSGPITADAATAKVVGIKKSITVSASATNKVTGLSKAEKNIVKVTKKGKKFTIKGLKAGKATFKIGKKSYTVKVGATTVKAAKTKLTLTKGKSATLKFTTKSGNGDTLTFKASNKNVTLAKKSAKIAKSAASVKATAKKAGKTTITATSKATGKKATVTVTVKNPAKPATTTPGASNTPVATATGSATNTPEATATATATASGSATNTPDVTATPVATATGTATATPVVTGSATNTPEATEVPTEAPTKAPEVVTGGTITVTTNVSGASIKVISGTAVIAEKTTGTTTGAAIDAVENGSYIIEVSKEGYETAREIVTVNGDTKVDIALAKITTIKVLSATAQNSVDGKTVELNGATNIVGDKDRGITVTFDTALAEKTVNVNNIRILKDGVNQPLSAVTLSSNKKSVVVNPVSDLKDDTTYTLVISPDVKAEDSDAVLGTEYTASFKTGELAYAVSGESNTYFYDGGVKKALSKSTTTLFTGATVEKTGDKLCVKYNKTLDPSTVNTSTVKLYNKTDKKYVGVTASIASDGVTIEVAVAANLDTSKMYVLEISGVKALLGVSAVDEKFAFVTNATAITATATTANGSTSLRNAYVYPKLTAGTLDNDTTVQLGARFFVAFDQAQAIDATTVDTDTITLVKWDAEKSESLGSVDVTVSYDAATRRATVTPISDLADGVSYRLKVKGVKDEFATTVDEQEFYFTTYDVTAPTVTNVQIKEGATGTFKNVNSGVTGIDENKTLYVKVDFSEEIDAITTSELTTASTATGIADYDTAIILDAASGKAAQDISVTGITRSTDNKSLVFEITRLSNNATYTLMLAGKTGLPTGSGSSTAPIVDTVDSGSNQNRMVETYSFSFSTTVADVTKPTLDGVKIGSYKDGDELNAATNVLTNKVLKAQFSEEVSLVGYPIEIKEGTAPVALSAKPIKGNASSEDLYVYVDGADGTDEDVTTIHLTKTQASDAGWTTDINVSVGSVVIVGGTYAVVTDVNATAKTITLDKAVTVTEDEVLTYLPGITLSTDATTNKTTMSVDLATVKNGTSLAEDTKITLTFKKANIIDTAAKPNAFENDVTYTFLTADDNEKVKDVYAEVNNSDKKLPTTNVDKDTKLLVNFGEAVNVSDIDAKSVSLKSSDGSVISTEIDTTNAATPVSGGTYNGEYCAVIVPKNDLTAGEEYTVTVDGLHDLAGNKIAKYSKTFVVKAETTFVSSSISDGDKNVSVTPAIKVTVKNATNIGTNVTLQNAAGAAVNTKAVVDGDSVTLYPYAPLASYSEYKVVIASTIGLSDKKEIAFTTASASASDLATGIQSATYDKAAGTIVVKYNVPIKINASVAVTLDGAALNGTAVVSTVNPTELIIKLASNDVVAAGSTQIAVTHNTVTGLSAISGTDGSTADALTGTDTIVVK